MERPKTQRIPNYTVSGGGGKVFVDSVHVVPSGSHQWVVLVRNSGKDEHSAQPIGAKVRGRLFNLGEKHVDFISRKHDAAVTPADFALALKEIRGAMKKKGILKVID
jgi:hypothetical protein